MRRYCLLCCGGNLTNVDKKRFDDLIREAGRIIGMNWRRWIPCMRMCLTGSWASCGRTKLIPYGILCFRESMSRSLWQVQTPSFSEKSVAGLFLPHVQSNIIMIRLSDQKMILDCSEIKTSFTCFAGWFYVVFFICLFLILSCYISCLSEF